MSAAGVEIAKTAMVSREAIKRTAAESHDCTKQSYVFSIPNRAFAPS
jgi:hypothetical protein